MGLSGHDVSAGEKNGERLMYIPFPVVNHISVPWRKIEAKIVAVVENLVEVLAFDPKGKVLFSNPSAREFWV